MLLVASSFLPSAGSLQGDGGLAEKGADNLPQPRPQLREGEGTADGLVLEDTALALVLTLH